MPLICLGIQPTLADVTVLPIGDSLTAGRNASYDSDGNLVVPARASYRPFLWDTTNHYLHAENNNPLGLSVDFIGSVVGPGQPPVGTPDFDPHHQAVPGLSTQSFSSPTSPHFIGASLSLLEASGQTPDLALIMLGTNDLYINPGGGWNRSNPLGLNSGSGVVGDIGNIAEILRNGYVTPNGMQLASGNSDIEVVVGAIPYVDARRRWDATNPLSSGFLWTEAERGEDVDGDPSTNLTTNEVIHLINGKLADLAAEHDYITFVNTMAPTYLINDTSGTLVPVHPDDNGNPQGFDAPDDLSDLTYLSDSLIDGVHFNQTGDQIVAGNFWNAGLRNFLSATPTAAPVPEPRSFLVSLLLAALPARRLLRKSAAGAEAAGL